jgi:hypothetical protein
MGREAKVPENTVTCNVAVLGKNRDKAGGKDPWSDSRGAPRRAAQVKRLDRSGFPVHAWVHATRRLPSSRTANRCVSAARDALRPRPLRSRRRSRPQILPELQDRLGDKRLHRQLVWRDEAGELDCGGRDRLESTEAVRQHLQEPRGRSIHPHSCTLSTQKDTHSHQCKIRIVRGHIVVKSFILHATALCPQSTDCSSCETSPGPKSSSVLARHCASTVCGRVSRKRSSRRRQGSIGRMWEGRSEGRGTSR